MIDLYAQYLSIKKEIDGSIKQVIKESLYIGGKYVEKLEKAIADYCGVKYAVSLNSGTDALYLSLRALDVGKDDEVITTPFTFFATAEVIAHIGAKPIFIDIDAKTFNINPELIEKKISQKTKAIIPVHLFGLPAEMNKIKKIAEKYKLYIIEDACQAISAEYKKQKIGSIGDIGCFSFYPTKNLGAYGDGGMIVTNNKDLADKMKILRNHGSKIKYDNEIIGINSRLDGIQAAVLLTKFKYLDKWNKKRKQIADKYNQLLKNISWLVLPSCHNNQRREQKFLFPTHIYHQYTIRVKNGKRDLLQKHLAENNISSIVYYPVSLHLLPAFKYLNYKKGDFPESEKASREVLSLPIYPEMPDKYIYYICDKIREYNKI